MKRVAPVAADAWIGVLRSDDLIWTLADRLCAGWWAHLGREIACSFNTGMSGEVARILSVSAWPP